MGRLDEDDLNLYTVWEEHTIDVFGSYEKLHKLALILNRWGKIDRLKKYWLKTAPGNIHIQHTNGDCFYSMIGCNKESKEIGKYWKKPKPFISFTFRVNLGTMKFPNVSSKEEAFGQTPFNNL